MILYEQDTYAVKSPHFVITRLLIAAEANSFATISNEILACILNTINSVLRNAQLSLKQCEC